MQNSPHLRRYVQATRKGTSFYLNLQILIPLPSPTNPISYSYRPHSPLPQPPFPTSTGSIPLPFREGAGGRLYQSPSPLASATFLPPTCLRPMTKQIRYIYGRYTVDTLSIRLTSSHFHKAFSPPKTTPYMPYEPYKPYKKNTPLAIFRPFSVIFDPPDKVFVPFLQFFCHEVARKQKNLHPPPLHIRKINRTFAPILTLKTHSLWQLQP